eukprot:c49827_g1_i1 orf=1-177(-)
MHCFTFLSTSKHYHNYLGVSHFDLFNSTSGGCKVQNNKTKIRNMFSRMIIQPWQAKIQG